MTEKQKEILDELRNIRLTIFRSAAHLDQSIDSLEMFLNDESGAESAKLCTMVHVRNRHDYARKFMWDRLYEKETELWQNLFDSIE